MSVASSWRFFISSTDSPKGRYSILPKSLQLIPAPRKMSRAFSSVPDLGADRDALALQVTERLDAGVGGGDDLDVVGVDGGNGTQLLQRRLEAGFLVAFPGFVERIAEREGDLAASGLQQVQVLRGGLGCLDRGLGAGRPCQICDSATPSG